MTNKSVRTLISESPDAGVFSILEKRLERLKSYHAGDDSPYAYDYGGYTVGQTRSVIKARIKRIKEKYTLIKKQQKL